MKRLTYLALAISFIIGIALTFDACKKEGDLQNNNELPALNEYNLNDNVVVLDSTIVPLIEGDKYTFNFNNEPPDIKVGDIIVGQSGDGFIKKVLSIESSNKSTDFLIILILGQAFFEEVFEDCNFDLNIPIVTNEISFDGEILYKQNINGTEVEVKLGDAYSETGLDVNFKLIRNNGVTNLFSITATGSFNSKIEATLSSSKDVQFGHEVDLIPPPGIKYPFLIGPVPAVFSFGIYAGFDMSVSHYIEYGYSSTATAEVEIGAEYNNNIWENTWIRESEYHFNYVEWEKDQETMTEIYMKPEIKLLICGIVGPTLNIKPFYSLETETDDPNWMWELNGGISGNLDFELSVFGFFEIAEYNIPLVTWEIPIASDQGTSGSDNTLKDPRDDQEYDIVTIGDQTWFAENLNYETADSWCYDNNVSNCNEYGRLYKWDAATTACPDGWHLPTDDEWKILEMYLGMSQSEADKEFWRGTDEGKKLKSTSGWNSDGNGTDAVGFTAFPSGLRNQAEFYTDMGDKGYWWSATEYLSNYARGRTLYYNYNQANRTYGSAESGFSVRCIKD